jgi:hypothetical protein
MVVVLGRVVVAGLSAEGVLANPQAGDRGSLCSGV